MSRQCANSFVFKALAATFVKALWKISTNGCHRAATRDQIKFIAGDFENAELRRSYYPLILGQFTGTHREHNCQIISHPTGGLNINPATVHCPLFKTPELFQHFWVIEQFDLALDQKMLEVSENLPPRVGAERKILVIDPEFKQLLANHRGTILVANHTGDPVFLHMIFNLLSNKLKSKRSSLRPAPSYQQIHHDCPVGEYVRNIQRKII